MLSSYLGSKPEEALKEFQTFSDQHYCHNDSNMIPYRLNKPQASHFISQMGLICFEPTVILFLPLKSMSCVLPETEVAKR